MPDVRIFADDACEMAAVYVDGELKYYENFYESEALARALDLFGVQIEFDPDFMLGHDEDTWGGEVAFNQLAQSLGDIEEYKRNRERHQAQRLQETRQRQARELRDQADRLLAQARTLEQEADSL